MLERRGQLLTSSASVKQKSESGCPSLLSSKRKEPKRLPLPPSRGWPTLLMDFVQVSLLAVRALSRIKLTEILIITTNWMKAKKKLSIDELVKSIHQARPSLSQVNEGSKFMRSVLRNRFGLTLSAKLFRL